MSLRYAGRLVVQGGARAVQGVKDQASRSIKDTATGSSSSSSRQIRRFTSTFESSALKSIAAEEKRRKAEESLRIVMYLSCWGPN